MNRPTQPQSPVGVTITMQPDGMILLDFKSWGKVRVPPEVALEFVSSQKVRDSIRREVLTARNEITFPANEHNQDHAESERLIKSI